MKAVFAFFAVILLTLLAPGGSPGQEPVIPGFGSQVNLVMVPFLVSRGGHFAIDLKMDDFVLMEDGVPRGFTVFERPQEHRAIELVLLFDTTTWPMGGDWPRKLKQIADFANHWTEAMSQAVLASGGAEILASVYHFDGVRLERLCRSTSDPKELFNAVHHLLSPLYSNDLTRSQRQEIEVAIAASGGYGGDRRKTEEIFHAGGQTGVPAGVGVPLDLPPSREILPAAGWPGSGFRAWPLEAAIGTLKDSAAAPGNALRMLILFSEGRGGTTTVPEDVAEQAVAFGIPVFPVVSSNAPPARGSGGRGESLPTEPYIAGLGSMTGGHWFDVDDLSAGVVRDVISNVKNAGLLLARSQYSLGFAPGSPSGDLRVHALEVRFASKSRDKLSGGFRRAVY